MGYGSMPFRKPTDNSIDVVADKPRLTFCPRAGEECACPAQSDRCTQVSDNPIAVNSLPDAQATRNEYPMAEGLLDYFPNALAEVARLSFLATQQHHPGEPMHWDRSKSTEHRDKIMRHLVDAGGFDDKGIRHSVGLAWRALANLQVELEKAHGYPLPKAAR